MTCLVIDASVAVKWVVAEAGSAAAIALRSRYRFLAPDLLTVEATNILWKKARAAELTAQEASLACAVLARSEVDLRPMQNLMVAALDLAVALDHAAYDCAYLVLAVERSVPFATADGRLARKVAAYRGGPAVPEIMQIG